MKKIMMLFIVVLTMTSFAQFKDSDAPLPDVKSGILAQSSSSLFSFINPQNFHMQQSVGMSYASGGGQGMAMDSYTNSMSYKFSDNLNIQLDASVINTPYSTLGKQFNNSINGFYITNAAINYQPWKDVYISVQYRNLPYNMMSPFSYAGGYHYGFFNGF
ncbi:MAG: hypothetical protein WCA84_04625 [Ignavibacteriaceae bacterium]|jgi:hypothetical protein